MSSASNARRRILRDRTRRNRTVASLKRGRSLATHALVAGVTPENVTGFVNGMRTTAKRLGIQPVKVARAHHTVGGRQHRLTVVHHYTTAQVQAINAAYQPRKPEYKAAKMALTLAA